MCLAYVAIALVSAIASGGLAHALGRIAGGPDSVVNEPPRRFRDSATGRAGTRRRLPRDSSTRGSRASRPAGQPPPPPTHKLAAAAARSRRARADAAAPGRWRGRTPPSRCRSTRTPPARSARRRAAAPIRQLVLGVVAAPPAAAVMEPHEPEAGRRLATGIGVVGGRRSRAPPGARAGGPEPGCRTSSDDAARARGDHVRNAAASTVARAWSVTGRGTSRSREAVSCPRSPWLRCRSEWASRRSRRRRPSAVRLGCRRAASAR